MRHRCRHLLLTRRFGRRGDHRCHRALHGLEGARRRSCLPLRRPQLLCNGAGRRERGRYCIQGGGRHAGKRVGDRSYSRVQRSLLRSRDVVQHRLRVGNVLALPRHKLLHLRRLGVKAVQVGLQRRGHARGRRPRRRLRGQGGDLLLNLRDRLGDGGGGIGDLTLHRRDRRRHRTCGHYRPLLGRNDRVRHDLGRGRHLPMQRGRRLRNRRRGGRHLFVHRGHDRHLLPRRQDRLGQRLRSCRRRLLCSRDGSAQHRLRVSNVLALPRHKLLHLRRLGVKAVQVGLQRRGHARGRRPRRRLRGQGGDLLLNLRDRLGDGGGGIGDLTLHRRDRRRHRTCGHYRPLLGRNDRVRHDLGRGRHLPMQRGRRLRNRRRGGRHLFVHRGHDRHLLPRRRDRLGGGSASDHVGSVEISAQRRLSVDEPVAQHARALATGGVGERRGLPVPLSQERAPSQLDSSAPLGHQLAALLQQLPLLGTELRAGLAEG